MAYQLDGSTQILQASTTPVNVEPLTISCWAYYTTANNAGTLLSIDTTGSSFSRFQLRTSASPGTRIEATASSVTGTAGTAQSAPNFTASTWHHCAATFTSSAARAVFLNSVKTSNTTSITVGTVTRITIGATNSNSGYIQRYNGIIAELAIWNAVLTDAEIASLSKGFSPDQVCPQSLQFYAPLVRDLIDVRGGLTITNVNSATVATHPRIIT